MARISQCKSPTCPVCDEHPVDSTTTVLCTACERSWRRAQRSGVEDFIWAARRARACTKAKLRATATTKDYTP